MRRSGPQSTPTILLPDSGTARAEARHGPTAQPLLIRARIVAPVARPSIEDGALLICGSKICAVGRWRQIASSVPAGAHKIDLGEVVLLPGLINAHAHLDYTDMAGQLVPTRSFTDWIKLITEAKSGWGPDDFASSWRNGAEMLVRSGTTTVADIETAPDMLPDVWRDTPLRVISFIELTGVRSRIAPETAVKETQNRIAALSSGPGRVGVAPHAPYSTIPALLRMVAGAARARGWLLTTHVAESMEEYEMFRHARGPMFEWLKRNNRDMSDCGDITPVAHLDRNGLLGPNLLAVHANYLDPDDIALLARKGVSVVHCPRSHRYFNHAPFQYENLLRAGVRVCLGTDSLATVIVKRGRKATLNFFEEMREFASEFPDRPPREILRLCTETPAAALRLSGQIGCLAPGATADLIAIPHEGSIARADEAVIAHEGSVAVSMIDGRFVWPLPT
ncbi:MAG: amidohydrolase family protein [Verrucomicrobiota bacterium]|nr:amidohydrolase family protein [Verrucomicrobiota bacterium]